MPSTVEIIQQKEKEMLSQIVDVFEHSDARYYLACGSCLGAVRHKGFIPWDDDVDLYILGTEYDKVRALFCNHPNLEWHDNDAVKGYPFSFPKIVLKNSVLVESGMENNQYQEGIYIDVFPLVETSDNPFSLFVSEKIRYFRYAVIRLYYKQFSSVFRKIMNAFLKAVINPENVKKRLTNSYKKSKPGKEIYIDSGVFGKHGYLNRKSFEDIVEASFEDLNVRIPAGYDIYLTDYYGNYMELPPEDKRYSGHYIKYLEVDGDVLIRNE